MEISGLTNIVGFIIYLVLVLIALWGAFCVIMVWARVAKNRFKSEAAQTEFLDALEGQLALGDFQAAQQLCESDRRAVPQLAALALANRDVGVTKARQLVLDRFQRDILADLEHRLSWINTVIKSAPMVGLLGTVVGMMGAFATLAAAENVDPTMLAKDISFALVTTAWGLSIAIPLVLCMASINVRIRKMEDLAAVGLTRFFETFREAVGRGGKQRR